MWLDIESQRLSLDATLTEISVGPKSPNTVLIIVSQTELPARKGIKLIIKKIKATLARNMGF